MSQDTHREIALFLLPMHLKQIISELTVGQIY